MTSQTERGSLPAIEKSAQRSPPGARFPDLDLDLVFFSSKSVFYVFVEFVEFIIHGDLL